jgi:hypothetical protein
MQQENGSLCVDKVWKLAGLAVQIADDILDITGKQEDIGKDVGSDLKKKKTFPAFGLESRRRACGSLTGPPAEGFDRKADRFGNWQNYINRVNCDKS